MKITFCIVFLFITITIQAQKKDYLKTRHKIALSCGETIDSSHVFENIHKLEALDTSRIKKNLHQYYLDLGAAYWLASGLKQKPYADKSIVAFNKVFYHEPHNRRALWDLAFVYGFLHNCERARAYFVEYHKYTPVMFDTVYSSQQEKELLDKCESTE